MKLNIFKRAEFTEPEVTLKYSEETPQIENLIDTLRIFCQSIQAEKKRKQPHHNAGRNFLH